MRFFEGGKPFIAPSRCSHPTPPRKRRRGGLYGVVRSAPSAVGTRDRLWGGCGLSIDPAPYLSVPIRTHPYCPFLRCLRFSRTATLVCKQIDQAATSERRDSSEAARLPPTKPRQRSGATTAKRHVCRPRRLPLEMLFWIFGFSYPNQGVCLQTDRSSRDIGAARWQKRPWSPVF